MKKKTFRERYEDNYRAISVPANNKKGFKVRYVYYKPWHVWDLPYGELRARKIQMGALLALSLSFLFFAGTRYVEANFDRFVGIPVMLSGCAFLYQAVGIFQFCASKGRTTEDNYQDVTYKIMFATLSGSVLLYLAAVGCIANMTSTGFTLIGILVAAGYLASAGMSMSIRRLYKGIPLRTEANMSPVEGLIEKKNDRS